VACSTLALGLGFAVAVTTVVAEPASAPAATRAPSTRHAADVPLETIVVEGDRDAIRREAEAFVANIVADAWKPLARWRRPLCPLIAGMTPGQGEWVLLRLSEIARATKVPLGRRDCRANLYVVLTAEPDRLVRLWRERDPGMFGDAPPAEIERFLTSSRPVRVWYTTERTSPEGVRLDRGERLQGGGLIVRHVQGWRLEWNVVTDIAQAIVVVDTMRTAQLRLSQLADFVALVGMAEIDLNARIGSAPTILRLFEPRSDLERPPGGLSSWDTAFLRGLYGTTRESTLQRQQVTREVVEEASR
jgi:hypothetical protein